MNWIALNNIEKLEQLNTASDHRPQVIFKHSIWCSISAMIKSRLEKNPLPEGIDFYYLDLINYRNISNKVAEAYNVRHESPQVLVIKNGKCIYNKSHNAIYMEDIIAAAV